MKLRNLWRQPFGVLWLVMPVWFIAVSGPADRLIGSADRLGCVGPHVTQYLVLSAAGMVMGLAYGSYVQWGAERAARALMPSFSDRRRTQAVQALSLLLIIAGMMLVFPWLNARVDQFVGAHAILRAEIDLVVFLMGGLSGAAWVLVWRRHAWIGPILSMAMLLMMLVNTLTRHAWC